MAERVRNGRLTWIARSCEGGAEEGAQQARAVRTVVTQDARPKAAERIVDAHGGRITATSRGLGEGATFSMELATAPAAATVPRPPRRPARTRVLLVEDNGDNAAAIAELLRLHGYDVDVAETFESALREAEKGFDVLVSDIGLPDGTGRDLVQRLAARGAVRAIALTGYGTEDDVRSNSDAGFARHLTKPVDPDEPAVRDPRARPVECDGEGAGQEVREGAGGLSRPTLPPAPGRRTAPAARAAAPRCRSAPSSAP